MFVSMFAKPRQLRHHQDWLAVQQGGQNGAHSSMRDNQGGLREPLLEFSGFQELDKRNVAGLPATLADLGEHVLAPCISRPLVDDFHHTVEGQVGSDGHENHRTFPFHCGPPSRAR